MSNLGEDANRLPLATQLTPSHFAGSFDKPCVFESLENSALMVFEDIHWSDPTTRGSLDLLVDRIPTLRVLLIITFRPEFTPPWIGRTSGHSVHERCFPSLPALHPLDCLTRARRQAPDSTAVTTH